MTPAAVIEQAKAEGIMFSISTEGKLKLRGESSAIDRLLPAIQEQKTAIMRLLRKPAHLIVTGYRCNCGSISYLPNSFKWKDLQGRQHPGFVCLNCTTRYWMV